MNCSLCQNSSLSEYMRVPELYWVCLVCGLVWLDKKHHLSPEKELARYKTHQNSEEKPEYLNFLSKLAVPVQKFLHSGDVGLDFGSGEARGMAKLLPEFSIFTYDPFFHPDKSLLKNSYNFILCSEVVEHFYDPRREFDLLDKLLLPQGILGVSSNLLVEKEKFQTWYYRRDPTHASFFAEKTVHWLAENYDWKILELESPIWIFQKN